MRLGGPVSAEGLNPHQWVEAHRLRGYSAAYAPGAENEPLLMEYVEAAQQANLLIAEVGAWSNPISDDKAVRSKALDTCCRSLAKADRIGARCCVNIAGSRGDRHFDCPDPANFSDETFGMIVDSVRWIIDTVKPTRTYYTLEMMPWIFPDSADSYLELIQAVDRKHFAVHLDPVNIINSPRRAFRTGEWVSDCFRKLGPYIQSCHAKDIRLGDRLTVHLDECRPGAGVIDYRVYLRELAQLDPDTPLMLEHLSSEEEYAAAAAHIRTTAAEIGVEILAALPRS